MVINHTRDKLQNSQPIVRLWNVASSYQAIKSKFLILTSASDRLSGQNDLIWKATYVVYCIYFNGSM